MSDTITPVNITSAAIMAQFIIVGIIAGATAIIRWGEGHVPFYRQSADPTRFFLTILGFALVTLGLLFFSDQFSSTWRPLFNDLGLVTVPWHIALTAMFLLDIVLIAIMVFRTGGSILSAYSPLFFILPALAIFLREPLPRIMLYVTAIIVAFSLTMVRASCNGERLGGERRWLAYWVVSIASLGLTTLIGYITRPSS